MVFILKLFKINDLHSLVVTSFSDSNDEKYLLNSFAISCLSLTINPFTFIAVGDELALLSDLSLIVLE